MPKVMENCAKYLKRLSCLMLTLILSCIIFLFPFYIEKPEDKTGCTQAQGYIVNCSVGLQTAI